jgi:hypothetical protein
VKVPGCNPVNFVIGGISPQYLNESCYREPSVPTSAVASLKYGCAGFASPEFAVPAGQTYCANLSPFNIGRNSITGPQFYNLDFSVHKTFPITRISEQFKIQFRAEFFDVTNHTNFVPPQPCSGDCNSGLFNSDGSSASVGTISQLANPETPAREIQFALKAQW